MRDVGVIGKQLYGGPARLHWVRPPRSKYMARPSTSAPDGSGVIEAPTADHHTVAGEYRGEAEAAHRTHQVDVVAKLLVRRRHRARAVARVSAAAAKTCSRRRDSATDRQPR